jgi:hypothetical protein
LGRKIRELLDIQKRFWNKVNKTETCWLWEAAVDGRGYGIIRLDNKLEKAHRLSYIWYYGDIPDGLIVMHECDVKKCVNPQHLIAGTVAKNNEAARNRGLWKPNYGYKMPLETIPRGESCGASKLKKADVIEIRRRYPQETQEQLGKAFGVTSKNIGYIVRGVTWKHL